MIKRLLTSVTREQKDSNAHSDDERSLKRLVSQATSHFPTINFFGGTFDPVCHLSPPLPPSFEVRMSTAIHNADRRWQYTKNLSPLPPLRHSPYRFLMWAYTNK